MIKNLTLEQEKSLANQLYFSGGYTKKYQGGGVPLLPGAENDMYQTGNPLVSDAETGKVSGGTLNQRREAKGKSPIDGGAIMGAGLNVAGAAIDALDDDPGYGNADVASSTLKFAAMGATAGPIGAAVGAAVGLGVGLIQKRKFKKAEKKAAYNEEQEEGYALAMKDKEELSGYAYGGEIKDYYGGGLTIGQKFGNMNQQRKANKNKRQKARASKNLQKDLVKGYGRTEQGQQDFSEAKMFAKANSKNIFQRVANKHRYKKGIEEDHGMYVKEMRKDVRGGDVEALSDYRAIKTLAGKADYTNKFGDYGNSSDVVLADKKGVSTYDAQKLPEHQNALASRGQEDVEPNVVASAGEAEVFAVGGDIPYVYPNADMNRRIGYGEGWTGPPIEAHARKDKTPITVRPEVKVAAAKKLNLDPTLLDISTKVDNTGTGLNYTQAFEDRAGSFRDKWGLREDQTVFVDKPSYPFISDFATGGTTTGEYSHKTNPLTVVDKDGNDTGMELTGGEGVFDEPFMQKLKSLLASGSYQEAGKSVQSEMRTWKHT